ncbi:hypothetical protein, partial [Faecalibacterium sp. Marseille-P9590]|uniref:hypothetical protein n=1 Tax=Faecalibacterium sp. Marseille-P9590 TaxID=2817017 RepID=UPI001A9AC906
QAGPEGSTEGAQRQAGPEGKTKTTPLDCSNEVVCFRSAAKKFGIETPFWAFFKNRIFSFWPFLEFQVFKLPFLGLF